MNETQKLREKRLLIDAAEVLRELVSEEPTHEVFHDLYCIYCEGRERHSGVEHYEFCPWIKAKSLAEELKDKL